MAEDTIFVLEADAEPVLAAFDEIDTGAMAMADSISQAVAECEDQFAALTASMAELSQMTADGAAEAASLADADAALAESLDSVTTAAATASDAIASAGAAATAAAAAEDADAASTEGLGAAFATMSETVSGAMDALNAAMGPLMMVGMVGMMVGGKLVGMGLDGQKGEALLRGMAGASQQDIQLLQVEAEKLGVNMKDAAGGFYEVESAGYSGAKAILVFDAAMKLSEGGQADAQNVMTGLTAIMHDYNYVAGQSTDVTDLMATTVLKGKQSMQDFATAIGPLAASGHKAGDSLQEVLAAEATMTQINPHVRQDAQQLAAMFDSLDPKMGKVEATAKKLGISFSDAHYKSLDLLGKLQYLAQIAGGATTPAFAKLVGGVRGAAAASDLLSGKASTFKDNLLAMSHSAGATENAFQQWEHTIPGALGHVGAQLSIFATKLMDAVGPKIIPIIDNVSAAIGRMADWVLSHGNEMIPILAGIAAVIGTVLVTAVVSFVAAAWPLILIALGIGAAVAGVVYAFQHWGDIMKQVHGVLQNPIIHTILKVLQDIGSYIASLFVPVWQQLVSMWQTQLMPLFKQLWGAIQPLMPLFELIGAVIGAVVIVALALLVATLSGVIKGLAGFLSGLMIVIHGVVQIFTGLVQVFSGLFSFFMDLFTGHFDKLSADLGMIWQGIINIFMGAWTVIAGIFLTAWYTISGIVTGFIDGIIGFFTHLWDAVVGHSIIPDMINGIISWFEQLPSKAMNFISSLVAQMTGVLGTLKDKAIGWAGDMINGFISGIQSHLPNLASMVSNIAGTVKKLIGFSKPEEGPLADFDKYAPDMIEMFSTGLEAHSGRLKQAMTTVAGTLATAAHPTALASPMSVSPATSLSGGMSSQLLGQILATLQQQQRGGQISNVPPSVTMYNSGMNFNGVQNLQELYQALNTMAGTQNEYMARGAY